MDNLTDLEKPAETDYLNCIRCGLCLSVCPTYREYLSETASPRGRVALTRKGLEGQLELSPNLMEQMYSCFACMACNDVCPVGIRPANLTLAMRFVQEQRQPTGWKRSLFEGLISPSLAHGNGNLAAAPLSKPRDSSPRLRTATDTSFAWEITRHGIHAAAHATASA